jgi:hypothetical protein
MAESRARQRGGGAHVASAGADARALVVTEAALMGCNVHHAITLQVRVAGLAWGTFGGVPLGSAIDEREVADRTVPLYRR